MIVQKNRGQSRSIYSEYLLLLDVGRQLWVQCIKAAIFGHDANWGRILCALGYSGAKFDPENVDLYFESKSGKIHIFGNGVACDYSEEEATKILSDPEVTALVDMHMGEAEATAWGCDLSYDYVKINADYRS